MNTQSNSTPCKNGPTCRFFQYNNCFFNHGTEKPVTPNCRYGLLCNKKDTCKFIHPVQLISDPTVIPDCRYGFKCIKKGTCKFIHPVQVMPALPAIVERFIEKINKFFIFYRSERINDICSNIEDIDEYRYKLLLIYQAAELIYDMLLNVKTEITHNVLIAFNNLNARINKINDFFENNEPPSDYLLGITIVCINRLIKISNLSY